MAEALPEVNELLLQSATPEQRDAFRTSALDDYLRDAETSGAAKARQPARAEPSLDSFIPRRGDGLMLSASDIETYRLCPLKYKFARVFRIPQEPSINQRFGIVVHQVLERFHSQGGGSLDTLMELFEATWRRSGFSSSHRRPPVPGARGERAPALLGARAGARLRAGGVRAQLRLQARPAPAPRARGPGGPSGTGGTS